MINNISNEFRAISLHFCPQLQGILYHDSAISRSTWDADIETGKAVEMTALCALISAFTKRGYDFILPSIFVANPDLFYLRNSIPRHHEAQAGHESAFENSLSLKDRFIAALTPKAELRNDTAQIYSIFREGHPIHKISHKLKNNFEYLDRPDIVIAQGEMRVSSLADKEIGFLYTQINETISGKLRIKNDNTIPIISYAPISGGDVLINGIIECSVGKGRNHATSQLMRYRTLFASVIVPVAALINGQNYTGKHIEHEIFINLDDWNRQSTIETMTTGFDRFVEVIDSNLIKI